MEQNSLPEASVKSINSQKDQPLDKQSKFKRGDIVKLNLEAIIYEVEDEEFDEEGNYEYAVIEVALKSKFHNQSAIFHVAPWEIDHVVTETDSSEE